MDVSVNVPITPGSEFTAKCRRAAAIASVGCTPCGNSSYTSRRNAITSRFSLAESGSTQFVDANGLNQYDLPSAAYTVPSYDVPE